VTNYKADSKEKIQRTKEDFEDYLRKFTENMR
jgi:hypothetical protein